VNRAYDVAIAGGGIAGSVLGLVLARAGLGVVIVEREAVFRDRVRGESIHPWGVAEAYRLGIAPTLKRAGAIDLPVWQRYENRLPLEPYAWADDSIDGRSEVSVAHPALQEAMLTAAAEAGASVLRPAKVTTFRGGTTPELDVSRTDGVTIVRARLVVGADGRTSAARAWTGGTGKQDPPHHRIGGALYEGVELDEGRAHDAILPGGRLIAFPQRGGRTRVYAVTAMERYDDLRGDTSGTVLAGLCETTFPAGSFVDASKAGPVAFFPNNDTWASKIEGNGAVLVGDAAGANDPSVGQGLSIAFRDARVLSQLLFDRSDWSEAVAEYAVRRNAYHDVLRQHARWVGELILDQGPEADRRRERAARAREVDPTSGGFALIFARGPDGLVADDNARKRFFGETE
jgi:menaquinone-9 beta-reductase